MGRDAGSLNPESLVSFLPPRPQSAPSLRKLTDRGALSFTGGGGLGFNSTRMSTFSVTRGASVGAAFDNSAKRFNPFFNMSRHHYKEEQQNISAGAYLSSTSGGERRFSPGQKGPTLYQASFSKSDPAAAPSGNCTASGSFPSGGTGVVEQPMQAGGGVFARSFHATQMHKGTTSWQQQMPRQREASARGNAAAAEVGPGGLHARRFEASHMHNQYGGTHVSQHTNASHRRDVEPGPRLEWWKEARSGSAGSARAQSVRPDVVRRPCSAQPSLRRPAGLEESNGRSDDPKGKLTSMCALALTHQPFTSAHSVFFRVDGEFLQRQRVRWSSLPELLAKGLSALSIGPVMQSGHTSYASIRMPRLLRVFL